VGATGSCVLIVIGKIARIISLYTPLIFLLVLMSVLIFICILVTLVINPRDKRRESNIEHENEVQSETEIQESIPLLSNE